MTFFNRKNKENKVIEKQTEVRVYYSIMDKVKKRKKLTLEEIKFLNSHKDWMEDATKNVIEEISSEV